MAKAIVQKDLPKVKELCINVLGHNYVQIERMGGLTNHTYHVIMEDGKEYVVRIPGDGTEELIVRSNEKISTELACKLEIDAQMLYFGKDGSKVTEYIPSAITMTADTLKEDVHIYQIADIFRKLHTCGVDTGIPFEVFDMAMGYEKIISDNQVPIYDDYLNIKSIVMKIKAEIDANCKITIVPCHNDALCANWVTGENGKMYLIDWEYAGMNDGMWDLADVSIEANYDRNTDNKLLKAYLKREPHDIDWKHFLASKIYVDYLWTLWAKTRVPYDGQSMEDWAIERYTRLKANINEYKNI